MLTSSWSPALSDIQNEKSFMFYVYVLNRPKSSYIYIGYTNNLERRMNEHKTDKPDYKLVYYEAYLSEKDARQRERKLKDYGSSLGHLRKRLKNCIEC